ncbi:MAG: hypothetical protein U5K36_16940 [Roseovarius sp.]|nr:hypothetical protein [Roseovarius sp.]
MSLLVVVTGAIFLIADAVMLSPMTFEPCRLSNYPLGQDLKSDFRV